MSIMQFLEQEQHQAQGQIRDYISPSRLSLWLKCPLACEESETSASHNRSTGSDCCRVCKYAAV